MGKDTKNKSFEVEDGQEVKRHNVAWLEEQLSLFFSRPTRYQQIRLLTIDGVLYLQSFDKAYNQAHLWEVPYDSEPN